MSSGNGSKPRKSAEQVASELRKQLEQQLGRDRTDAIWRDPTNVHEVVEGEDEAAAVAETILRALHDLPEEEPAPRRRGRSGFRRGLQIALIAAISVWALSIIKKARGGNEP
jgi:hypothetical protein